MVTVNQSQYTGANISQVIDYTLTESPYASEPVTVALAKQWCRALTGTAEDSLFAILIPAARKAVEHFTGLSLVPKMAEVKMLLPEEMFEIPYGPVTSTPVWVDFQGNPITVEIQGFDFPKVQYNWNSYITATYNCGYLVCPDELKLAILYQVNFMYENRGDNNDNATLCAAAQKIAQRYSRIPFFS